jgi:cytochrome d ubiquinol oxidase subunit II
MSYVITTVVTLIYFPHITETARERSVMFIVALINMFAIANIPREINRQRDGRAFLSSCLNIFCLIALYGLGTFPNVVRASNAPDELSLTIRNSASSEQTLATLLLISLIGIPLVLSYTIGVYWIFKGKVKLESTSY